MEPCTRVPHRRWLAATLAAPRFAPAPAHAHGLTGDWGGERTRLADSGVALRADVTGFVQGKVAGTGDKVWDTSSRYDAYVDLGVTRTVGGNDLCVFKPTPEPLRQVLLIPHFVTVVRRDPGINSKA